MTTENELSLILHPHLKAKEPVVEMTAISYTRSKVAECLQLCFDQLLDKVECFAGRKYYSSKIAHLWNVMRFEAMTDRFWKGETVMCWNEIKQQLAAEPDKKFLWSASHTIEKEVRLVGQSLESVHQAQINHLKTIGADLSRVKTIMSYHCPNAKDTAFFMMLITPSHHLYVKLYHTETARNLWLPNTLNVGLTLARIYKIAFYYIGLLLSFIGVVLTLLITMAVLGFLFCLLWVLSPLEGVFRKAEQEYNGYIPNGELYLRSERQEQYLDQYEEFKQ